MNATASSTTTLFNYDTDRDLFPGRSIDQGGAGMLDLSPSKTAFFQYQVATNSTFAGTGYITLYGVPTSLNPLDAGGVNVYLRRQVGGVWTDVGSWNGSASPWGIAGYGGFVIPLTGLNFTVAASQRIQVAVQVAGASSTGMHLGYDTTSFPANLSLPYTVGTP
jgi:hypothetical protein